MKNKKIKIFEELKQSLQYAAAYEQGKKSPVRVTEIKRSRTRSLRPKATS